MALVFVLGPPGDINLPQHLAHIHWTRSSADSSAESCAQSSALIFRQKFRLIYRRIVLAGRLDITTSERSRLEIVGFS